MLRDHLATSPTGVLKVGRHGAHEVERAETLEKVAALVEGRG